MSFRPWCLATATGLTLAASSSIGYSLTYEQRGNRAGDISNYSAIADFPYHVSTDPDTADAGCKQGHDNRKSDLCAQWKAADAAAQSADAAWLQVWIGSAVGILTLLAAIAAAVYAGAAARHTASSVAVAENLGRRGLRAYVEVDGVAWAEDGASGGARILISIRNAGQTPARFVRMSTVLIIRQPNGHRLLVGGKFSDTRSHGSIYNLPPGGTYTQTASMASTIRSAAVSAIGGGGSCIVTASIRYTDVFRLKRRSLLTFYMISTPTSEGPTFDFVTFRKGNRSY